MTSTAKIEAANDMRALDEQELDHVTGGILPGGCILGPRRWPWNRPGCWPLPPIGRPGGIIWR